MNSSLSPDHSVLSHFALPCSFVPIREREREREIKEWRGDEQIVYMQWSHSRNTTLRLIFSFSNWHKRYWENVCIINEEKREKHKYTDWKRKRTTVTTVFCCKMPVSCVLSCLFSMTAWWPLRNHHKASTDPFDSSLLFLLKLPWLHFWFSSASKSYKETLIAKESSPSVLFL